MIFQMHTPFVCWKMIDYVNTLQWRHNEHDSVSNHQPHDCLLNRLFGRRSKKTSKLRVTGLCAGNSTGTGEFPAQRASNAENVSIWWRHHDIVIFPTMNSALFVSSSPPSAAYMPQWIGLALVLIMACRLFDTKPLSKPLLGYCQLDP